MRVLLGLLAVLCCPPVAVAAADSALKAPPPIQILAYKANPTPSPVIYRYLVFNGSEHAVSAIEIGWDHSRDVFELAAVPRGWTDPASPPSGSRSPRNWDCHVVTREEDSALYLRWDARSPGDYLANAGGAGDFEVTLDRPDPGYEKGHWTVHLDGPQPTQYTGFLHVMSDSGTIVEDGSSDLLAARVLNVVFSRPIDGPDIRARSLGPEAAPVLRAMAADSAHWRHSGRVLYLLGYVGDSTDTKLIINSIMASAKGDSWRMYIPEVLSGLGRLSNRDTAALQFLKQASDPAFFGQYELNGILLSKYAISSIGFSRLPAAGAFLEELKKHPYDPSQMGNIEDAIRARQVGAK